MVRIENQRDDFDIETETKTDKASVAEMYVEDELDAVLMAAEILEILVLSQFRGNAYLAANEIFVDVDSIVTEFVEKLVGKIQQAK